MAASRLSTLSQHVQLQPARVPLCCQPCGSSATSPDDVEHEPPMSVFVLIGQSNMAGRGLLTARQDNEPPPPGMFCFGYDDDAWLPASQPLHRDPPIAASQGGAEPLGAGLGWAFARKLLDERLVDGSVGLVPCAFGGSPLSRWVKQACSEREHERGSGSDTPFEKPADPYEGNAQAIPPNPGKPGDLYERAWRRTKLALASHPNAVLRGFVWHQGESDATSPELATTVANRLTELIANLRDDLTAECVPFPYARRREFEVPFVIGELGHFLPGGDARPCVVEVQRQLATTAEAVADCALVSAEGLTHLGDEVRNVGEPRPFLLYNNEKMSCPSSYCLQDLTDHEQERSVQVHFDTESLYEFGQRYADAWAATDQAGSWRFQVAPVPPPSRTARALAGAIYRYLSNRTHHTSQQFALYTRSRDDRLCGGDRVAVARTQ